MSSSTNRTQSNPINRSNSNIPNAIPKSVHPPSGPPPQQQQQQQQAKKSSPPLGKPPSSTPPPPSTKPTSRPPPTIQIIKSHTDGTSSFKVSGTAFRVNAKFKPLGIIGKGSYGVVCAAENILTGENVAVKKIKPMCEDVWDAKHTLRELRLMRLMEKHPNVITLKGLNIDESTSSLYIIMELMDSDLHRIIQSKQKLTNPHCQGKSN